jgi:protein disulfide-isomerase-like protein
MKFLLLSCFLLSLFLVVLSHGDHGEHKPEDPAPGVIDITGSNADQYINSDTDSLVEFYAPWCGHCKSLAHDYAVLGEAMEKANPKNVVAGKVNCVAEATLCQKYGVQGYPTIKFFAKGVSEDYQGGRTVDDFIDFLNKRTTARLRVSKAPSYVVDLTPANFDQVVDDTKHVLVEFFAPWCGHCKTLAPKYELLGKAFASEKSVVIAKVDADKHKSLGEKFGVQGFPSLKFFKKGSKSSPAEFNRGSEQEMLDAVNTLAGTSRTLSGTLGDKAGRVSALDGLSKSFVASDAKKRKELLSEAQKSKEANAHYYVKAMQKIMEQGGEYATKEAARLGRIIASASSAASQMDEFTIIKNILNSFE